MGLWIKEKYPWGGIGKLLPRGKGFSHPFLLWRDSRWILLPRLGSAVFGLNSCHQIPDTNKRTKDVKIVYISKRDVRVSFMKDKIASDWPSSQQNNSIHPSVGCLANQMRLFPSRKWRETDSYSSLLRQCFNDIRTTFCQYFNHRILSKCCLSSTIVISLRYCQNIFQVLSKYLLNIVETFSNCSIQFAIGNMYHAQIFWIATFLDKIIF